MIKKIYVGLLFVVYATTANAQVVTVGQYNLENLFDIVDDPKINDADFLPTGANQWTKERYETKLKNMAEVIASFENGAGIDILSVCEVENKKVLEDLVSRKSIKKMNYGIVHSESPDERGIDVALLYKKSVFTPTKQTAYTVPLPDGDKTRDVLLVQGKLKNNAAASFIIVHFPSRGEGREKSEPKRIAAAQVVRNVRDAIAKSNPNEYIFIMGDFNDTPADSSISRTIGAWGNNDHKHQLYNPFYRMHRSGEGTYKYKGKWDMLDQIIVSSNTLNPEAKVQYIEQSATVYKPSFIQESDSRYAGTPKRTYAGPKYIGGYSDHFPLMIKMQLQK